MDTQTRTDHPSVTDPFRVGEWIAEPMANRLTRGDDVRRVEPKVMEVLAAMAARPGETVTKDEFMAEVWTGTIVTDDVLARCISELRKALGDKARNPKYVETLRKRGYALIAPVEHDVAVGGDGAEMVPAVTGVDLRRPVLPQRTRPSAVLWGLGVAAAVAVGALIAYRAGVAGVQPLSAVPVTSTPGDERDPALSPDGERVAFAWDGDGGGEERQFDIYVQETTGGTPLRLTTHPADETSPSWSPDGERVAYVRCGIGGECGVYVVEASGGSERTLLAAADLAIADLVWSPDGSRLAFSARRGRQGAFALHLLELDGSPTQRLTAPASTYPGDLAPAFSPDGRLLAFVRTQLDGRQDVAVVTVEGGRVRRLAREQKGVTGLDWMPDGREVVYAANRDGAAGLWRASLDGGEPRWVALGADGGEIASPSVGRAGGVVFARQLVRSQLAEVVDGAPRPLVPSTRDDRQPDVARDGRRVAFVSTRSGSHEVWTAAPDGSDARQLTAFGGARVSGPRWGPDGNLVVSARADGDADVFLVLPDGQVRKLTEGDADDVAPTWSADGRWVYFASNRAERWQIYRVPASGGAAEPVTVQGGVAAAEAPGGGLIVLRPDKRGLWLLPEVGGEPRDVQARQLRVNVSPADWANWTVAGGAVYALERQYDRAASIVRLDVATGRRTTLAAVADVPEDSGLGAFPDGRLVLSRQDRADSDVVYVEDFR